MTYIKLFIFMLFSATAFAQGVPLYKFYNSATNLFELTYDDAVAIVKVYEGYKLMESEIYKQYDKIDSLTFEISDLSSAIELRYRLQIQALEKSNEQLVGMHDNCMLLSTQYKSEVERLNGDLAKSQLNLKLEKVKSWVLGTGMTAAIIYIVISLL